MKKVLILTYYWPPSGGAGVQRTLKFVRYLPEFGIEPYVLTVDENKASYPVRDESLLKEIPQGLHLEKTSSFEPLNILAKIGGKEKVPYGGFSNSSNDSFTQKMLRWIRGNFFIPDARVGWVRFALKKASEIIQRENIDTVYISSPPHSSQLIGLKLRKRFPHIRWIADLRDPWTHIYYYSELLHTGPAKKADADLEKKVLQRCNHAVVVSNPIRKQFATLGNIPAEKISVIPNGYDESDFPLNKASVSEHFVITYVGTLAESYNPVVFFNALAGLVKVTGSDKIRFRLVGSAPPLIVSMISRFELEMFTEFIPYVPHVEAISYMQESHVNLLMIPDTQGADGILTGKLFEYLGAERPVLGIGPLEGEAAAIVRECGAGDFFSRDQAELIETWLQRWYSRWESGEQIRIDSVIHHKYRRRALTRQLAQLLRDETI